MSRDLGAPGEIVSPVTVFLFAHQDDEFGIFQNIILEKQAGRRILCVYLTDGGKLSGRRNKESLAVLGKLGVQEQDVLFIGAALPVPDGELPEHLEQVAAWLHAWLTNLSQLEAIYVPAWEGGHQDHDALHALTIITASQLGILDRIKQFPLYNAYRCVGPLFRVFHPLSANGCITLEKIPWISRFKFLGYCLSYPSQRMAWVGLLPFVVGHYLMSGVQILQPVSSRRIYQRPHDGILYYEKRRFYTWQRFAARLTAFENTDRL